MIWFCPSFLYVFNQPTLKVPGWNTVLDTVLLPFGTWHGGWVLWVTLGRIFLSCPYISPSLNSTSSAPFYQSLQIQPSVATDLGTCTLIFLLDNSHHDPSLPSNNTCWVDSLDNFCELNTFRKTHKALTIRTILHVGDTKMSVVTPVTVLMWPDLSHFGPTGVSCTQYGHLSSNALISKL